MSRLIVLALALLPQFALADDAVVEQTDELEDEDAVPDQSLGASLGIAGGGRTTPGGFRVEGHYLYQLAEQDWFDGTAAFTFGSGGAACFRDRMDYVICDHGFSDGRGVEAIAAVRRYFTAQGVDHGIWRPYARLGVGFGIARYSDDDVTGITIPAHMGGGVRANVSPQIAIVAAAEVVIGFARFGRGMGTEPQLGISVTAGAEFRLP